MAIELRDLLDPEHTAIVTMEVQRGVVGDHSTIPDLSEAADRIDLVPNIARLLEAGRPLGVTVLHCLAEWRADRRGTAMSTPIAGFLARNPGQILAGTPAADLRPELGPEPGDLISRRLGGVTPITGTEVDRLLRAEGVRTIVATGVSLNVGLLGLCFTAADLGYRVVVPRDAVAGVPSEYASMVLDHSVAMVAKVVDTDDVLSAWAGA